MVAYKKQILLFMNVKNMSKEIKINFTYTKELALKASKLFYDYDMKNSSKKYIGWLFIAMMQFGVVGALKHNSFGILFVATFLVIYWYYIRWYIRKFIILKYYDKSNTNNKKVVFSLNDDGLSNLENIISWDNIVRVIKLDDVILLQTNTNTLYFDKQSFNSYKNMQKFLSIMKEKGKF